MIRLPLRAMAVVALGVAILCALGLWQVQRMGWKADLLARLDAAYQADPADHPQTQDTLAASAARGDIFLRGTVTGRFAADKVLRGGPRLLDGQPGHALYMPLLLGDGSAVLVNRGWMPDDPTARMTTSQGTVTIAGLFRRPAAPNTFTPQNDPAQNRWYHIDPDQIAQHYGLGTVAPYVLYAESSPPGTWPQADMVRPVLNNNHRAYAMFWFTMAGVLVVIAILRFRRPG